MKRGRCKDTKKKHDYFSIPLLEADKNDETPEPEIKEKEPEPEIEVSEQEPTENEPKKVTELLPPETDGTNNNGDTGTKNEELRPDTESIFKETSYSKDEPQIKLKDVKKALPKPIVKKMSGKEKEVTVKWTFPMVVLAKIGTVLDDMAESKDHDFILDDNTKAELSEYLKYTEGVEMSPWMAVGVTLCIAWGIPLAKDKNLTNIIKNIKGKVGKIKNVIGKDSNKKKLSETEIISGNNKKDS